IHRWSKTKGMTPKGEPDPPEWVAKAFDTPRCVLDGSRARARWLCVFMRRRDFLQTAVMLAALSRAELAASAAAFNYAALKGRARALAPAAYRPPEKLAPQLLRDLSYDQYQAL